MRCKCCDVELDTAEEVYRDETKDYEDMCGLCIRKALYPDAFEDDGEMDAIIKLVHEYMYG